MDTRTVYDHMRHRRSIRAYKPDPVPPEILDRILEAATWAPSGKNMQNWRFYVMQGERVQEYLKYSQKSWDTIRPTLEKRLKPSLYKFTERFFYTLGGAPVLIMAYSKPDPEENNQTSIGSVYMAVQNLLIAADYEGLSTCAMGSPLEVKDEVNIFFNVPDDYDLVCGVTLGYADHEPPVPPRQTEGRIIFLN